VGRRRASRQVIPDLHARSDPLMSLEVPQEALALFQISTGTFVERGQGCPAKVESIRQARASWAGFSGLTNGLDRRGGFGGLLSRK
jgi:hypothetical protein